MIFRSLLLLCVVFLGLTGTSEGQRKKKDANKAPVVLMAIPFGIEPAKTTKIVLRGRNLENAKEVRVSPKGTIKLLKKNKVGVPNQQDAAKVGDSEVTVELSIPTDVPGDRVQVTVIGSDGESKPHAVLLDRTKIVQEKEPNEGFKNAQAVNLGEIIQGTINGNQDVDVYRFEGKPGSLIVVDVQAERLGSALDSFLTLYDAKGQILATSDDIAGSSDSRIEVVLKTGGTYYVAIADAHDQGGATHGYRLHLLTK